MPLSRPLRQGRRLNAMRAPPGAGRPARRQCRLRGLAILVLLACLSGCRDRDPPRPDVLVVTLDTVRADALDLLAQRAPHLHRLAAEGVRFEAAISPTPLTLPAHATIFSGLDPNRHGVRGNGVRVPDSVALLAQALAEAGYRTGAFVSAFPLDRQFGLDRGFEHYDDALGNGTGDGALLGLAERRAAATSTAALEWLAQHSADRPWFGWLHLFDAHAPYDPPGIDPGLPERERYLAEIEYLDRHLGTVLEAVRQLGRPTIVLVVADHGEGLGDHGERDHGLLLYDSTLRVPMIWHAPQRWQPRQVPAVARLADVTPTLLDALGLPVPPGLDGVSLVPSLSGQAQAIPPAYAETYYPQQAYRHAPLRSLRAGSWKAIATEQAVELYELTTDPDELHDRAADDPQLGDRLRFDAWSRPEPETPAAAIDDAQVQLQLQSLGYLSAGAAADPDAEEPHPLAVLATHNRLLDAQEQAARGDLDGAIQTVAGLRQDQPDNAFASYLHAQLLRQAGRTGESLAALEQALEAEPSNPQTRFALAEVLMTLGRPAQALEHWQALELLSPTRPAVWINEAAALAALGNWGEAQVAIDRALALAPTDPIGLENAIAIADQLGQAGELARRLAQLSQVQGGEFRQHARLAAALLASGEPALALARARATPEAAGDYLPAQIVAARAAHQLGDDAAARAALATIGERVPLVLANVLARHPELSGYAPPPG